MNENQPFIARINTTAYLPWYKSQGEMILQPIRGTMYINQKRGDAVMRCTSHYRFVTMVSDNHLFVSVLELSAWKCEKWVALGVNKHPWGNTLEDSGRGGICCIGPAVTGIRVNPWYSNDGITYDRSPLNESLICHIHPVAPLLIYEGWYISQRWFDGESCYICGSP